MTSINDLPSLSIYLMLVSTETIGLHAPLEVQTVDLSLSVVISSFVSSE